MSNYLAIAAVTAAIKHLLEQVGNISPGNVEITSISPSNMDSAFSSMAGKYKLNIFLYHVNSNASFRNSFLPSRNTQGELVNNSQIGLDLYYLLTVYSSKTEEDAALFNQRILGNAIRILNENPILSADIINNGASAYFKDLLDDPDKKILSDLADQKEQVKIGFHNLSLDELSKIWTSFFQTNYHVSVAYRASVVILDSIEKKVKSSLPVEDRLLYVEQLKRPLITGMFPSNLEWTLEVTKVEIIGENLNADIVKVRFDREIDSKPIPAENITNKKIVFEIPPGILSTIGRKQVQIIHPIMMGVPPVEHSGFESNTIILKVLPKIITITPSAEVSSGDVLKVDFQPAVSSKQKIEVILGDGPPLIPIMSSTIPAGSIPITSVSVNIPPKIVLPEKEYLIRLRIDNDIESLLQIDMDKKSPTYRTLIGPKIKVK